MNESRERRAIVRVIILTATLLVLAATSARAEFQICQHPFRPECSVSHVEYPCDVGWKQVMRRFDRRRDACSVAISESHTGEQCSGADIGGCGRGWRKRKR